MAIPCRPWCSACSPAGLAPAPGGAQARAGRCPGRHYQAHWSGLPPNDPARIDVVEFFWYGCPHCYVFEPVIEHWGRAQAAADVNFRRVHVQFQANMKAHQRMFFALEALGWNPRRGPASSRPSTAGPDARQPGV